MRMPSVPGMKKAAGARRVMSARGPVNAGLRGGVAARIITPWDWIIVPALLSLALTIVLATAWQPFGFYLPEPVSPFILAFSWGLIRPSFIVPFILAGLGLFLDMFWGAPLGFWTLPLMLVYGAVLMLRSYLSGQDNLFIFGIFMLGQLLFFTLATVMMTLDAGAVPRLWGVVEQMFATTLLFPFVLILLEKYLHADVRFM
ncbi:hypothetical protein [Asticcacaulis sp. EMRT-3]|uniref:hypothetical protein n=1 Tax=Asticcacaulis sp. EMRT-3 TaxID=3040349 RepID=UPI0024AF8B41|nr:hypothetical protein [Asticcacaulis sp. EMRT-3]MDI7775209.1 hypothetical protein [Asticcacaulis sp. EMRT-3]